MREFAGLYNDLDATTATTGKLYALKHYFGHAQPANAAWAVYFLAGGRRQIVPTKLLRQFSTEMAGIAVRFPRMLRIRNDTRIDEADTLETLRSMLT